MGSSWEISLPDPNNPGMFIDVGYPIDTREDAITLVRQLYGADEEGRVSIINELQGDDEECTSDCEGCEECED